MAHGCQNECRERSERVLINAVCWLGASLVAQTCRYQLMLLVLGEVLPRSLEKKSGAKPLG